ncbi:MAG TPA: TIGR02444 family protein [Stellaceae bacterium]|nr:TIGR02444 family protein [Stellaceae bacterium]
MAEIAEPFWTFALAFYRRPGVSSACIALQDRHGCDVNLMLYACWVGLSGRGRLAGADLHRAEAVAAPWRGGVIEKLRAARRAIGEEERRGAMLELYEAAKAVELAAERIAQRRLEALAPPETVPGGAARAADAAANLALYLAGKAADAAATPIVAAIREAARLA